MQNFQIYIRIVMQCTLRLCLLNHWSLVEWQVFYNLLMILWWGRPSAFISLNFQKTNNVNTEINGDILLCFRTNTMVLWEL